MTKRELCERLMNIYELQICEHMMRIYDDSKTFKVAEFDQVAADIKHLLLDLAAPVEEDTTAPTTKDFQNLPKMNPYEGSPDDIVPDGIGGWKRRGDDAITYTYGDGTNEATK